MRFLTRAIPTVCAMLVAAASFALSYVALRDVAAATQAVPAHLAWLTPICVDGAVLAGSASLWASSMRGSRKDPIAVLTVVSMLAVSVVVNTSHAGPTVLAKVIAALPPITLLACLELVANQYRRDAAAAEQEAAKDVPGVALGEVAAGQRGDGLLGTFEGSLPAPEQAAAVDVELARAAPTEPAAQPLPSQSAPPFGTTGRGAVTRTGASALPVEPAPAAEPAPVAPATPELASAAGGAEVAPDAPGPDADLSVRKGDSAADAAARPERVQTNVATRAAREPSEMEASGQDQASTADRVAQLFAEHLAAGGSPTDPSLARQFAAVLGRTPGQIRKHLGPLRRQDAPAA